MHKDLSWLAVNRTVSRLIHSSSLTRTESRVANFILDRTVPWRRLQQKISINEFIDGDMSKNICSIGLSRSVVYATIKRLLSVNVILKHKSNGNIYYGINCVPFVEVYIEGLKKLNKFDQAQKMIQVRDELVKEYNKDPDLEIKPIPGLSIKDALRAARKVSVDRAEKKAEKAEHSPTVIPIRSVTSLWQKIDNISKEYHKHCLWSKYKFLDLEGRNIYDSCMKKWMRECHERIIDMDLSLIHI